jgi:HK97 family phage prohead protease
VEVQKFVSPGGKRTISGLATTEQLDLQGDIVVTAGIVIPQLPLPLLFAHSHTDVIGAVHEARVVPEGLRIRAELVDGVPKADEVFKLVSAGALDSFSIGFVGLKGEPIPTGTRWTSSRLLEVSVVAVGANPGARMGKAHDGSVKLISPPRGAVKLVRVAR